MQVYLDTGIASWDYRRNKIDVEDFDALGTIRAQLRDTICNCK